ncbi:hypothetical protein Celal_1121 [Cellulophaga algicola DSM 14237]|uniref:Uncharacterized protein n=1 Tax=Cellulophaga algicola (strain DSM 14237 / IC166 / ACAM 630) TaxID=688270 RepID=E6X5S3_CELAD|nr:hypothetical protein [Cellulophaga algicola]ADV48439.1 hypothetical protein Celal_1121 [Cellulophaga algicola DSM 14237]
MEKKSKFNLFFKGFKEKTENFSLLFDFLMDFKYKNAWDRDIFPLLESVKTGKSFGVDWSDFIWGTICFRNGYVMFLKESIHQVGRKFPPIKDINGNALVDETGQWLENTEYIELNYSEFLKIPLDEFISICRKWYNEVL